MTEFTLFFFWLSSLLGMNGTVHCPPDLDGVCIESPAPPPPDGPVLEGERRRTVVSQISNGF
ncbi:MAG: hypothetical protein ACI8PZ_006088 [Myxococcota bacterium]|jgi:hypothetical protein